MKNRYLLIIRCMTSVLIFHFFIVTSFAQRIYQDDLKPQEVYERMVNNPAFIKASRGEDFCWQARVGMTQFIDKYTATKNTDWIDAGLKYCDFLIDRMDTAPDGYKGWIGPFLGDRRFYQDVLVGDALLFDGILSYCILIKENKELKKLYNKRINAYIKSAERNFFEKYDKRGTWIDDGPYGAYINSDKFLKADDLKDWVISDRTRGALVSHPFNKQMDAGLVCIKLYRLTKNKVYRDRAVKIFFTAKSHFQYFDDHYCWNYWEPLYNGDVDIERKDTRHGVWVHPWRSGYQASEIHKIVAAYHHGIVFNEQDIKRIINTNLNVMWNKDRENPKFISSNGLGADGDTVGLAAFQKAYGHSNVSKNSGELWTGLLDFDQTIRDLAAVRYRENPPALERYTAGWNNNPPSFERKHVVGKIIVPEISFTESKDLNLAVVLPHIVPQNGESVIVCQSMKPGELRIDLYSQANEKLCNLYTGKIWQDRPFMFTWDGKDPAGKTEYSGEYKIRWTINGGYREFPVVVNK